MNISSIIANIAAELPEKLGDRYEVSPYFPASLINADPVIASGFSSPDLVVLDKETNALTMIDFKGSNPSFDLPLVTAPTIRRMKAAYDYFDPSIVLVTASGVSQSLQEELNTDDVQVIQFKNLNQTVSRLVALIESQNQD